MDSEYHTASFKRSSEAGGVARHRFRAGDMYNDARPNKMLPFFFYPSPCSLRGLRLSPDGARGVAEQNSIGFVSSLEDQRRFPNQASPGHHSPVQPSPLKDPPSPIAIAPSPPSSSILRSRVGVHLSSTPRQPYSHTKTSLPAENVSERTFRFPPVIVTFTNRRVYVILFFARPLGVFFFSCGSTCPFPSS